MVTEVKLLGPVEIKGQGQAVQFFQGFLGSLDALSNQQIVMGDFDGVAIAWDANVPQYYWGWADLVVLGGPSQGGPWSVLPHENAIVQMRSDGREMSRSIIVPCGMPYCTVRIENPSLTGASGFQGLTVTGYPVRLGHTPPPLPERRYTYPAELTVAGAGAFSNGYPTNGLRGYGRMRSVQLWAYVTSLSLAAGASLQVRLQTAAMEANGNLVISGYAWDDILSLPAITAAATPAGTVLTGTLQRVGAVTPHITQSGVLAAGQTVDYWADRLRIRVTQTGFIAGDTVNIVFGVVGLP